MLRLHTSAGIILLACLALILLPVGAWAQSDSSQISGFVSDVSTGVIPGAQVTITNEGSGLERVVTTNETGYFVVTNLQPGYYTIAVESTGFKKAVSVQNKLDAASPLTANTTLEVGLLTEVVEVTAEAAQLQTETATVGRLVESKQIDKITLNGRNPLFLAQLNPGVIRAGSLAGFSFGLSSGGFSINGSRSQDNLISVDGAVNVRTRSNGTSIGTTDVETIQEMQVLTSNYNAEYGRGMSGQIRFVTKSGTRDFHGAFYDYFRNEKLDANSWSNNRAGNDRPANKFNQFGYVLSGPVYTKNWNKDKTKLFWLWSQEWVRFRESGTSIQTVAPEAMRNGDFGELLNPNNVFFGRARTVSDPDSGTPFANNIIPQNRLSRNGLALINAQPLPTPGFFQGDQNFIQVRPQPTDQRKDTISVDYNPASNHNVRFRLQNYNFIQFEAFRGGTDRALRSIDRPNRTYTMNYVYTISPKWITELTANVSYDRVFLEVEETSRLDRATYGIDYPYIFPERKEIQQKIPTITVSDFVQVDGSPYPASSSGPIYQAGSNTTWIAGNHTIKFGGRYERSGQNDFDQINVTGVPGGTNNQNGRFVFDDSRGGAPSSGLAIGNAALGLFTTYAEIGPRAFTPYRGLQGEAYLQDSWKVNEKLRLELGVRYSIQTPYYYSVWRNMAVFDPNAYDSNNAAVLDPATGNVLSGDRFNGVVIPGDGFNEAARGRVPVADSGEFDRLFSGGPKYWGKVQKLEFQPRIGVAYRLDSKSVFRTGFGRYLARPGVADNVFLGGNPPFQPTVSISAGLADDPGAGESAGFPQFFMTQDNVFRIPASYQWNATYQREVGFGTVVEVGYVGRAATHMERARDLNGNPAGTTTANPGVNANFLRPFKGFANIITNENASRSEYNGLQVSANRRFANNLSFGVAYTYSKSEDNASDRRGRIWDAYDDSTFWGPSDFDRRHVLVNNFVWDLPRFDSGNGAMKALLGGWTLSGVVQFQTGRPRTIGRSVDVAGIGEANFQPWENRGDPTLSRSDRGFSEGVGNDNVFFFNTTDGSGNPLFFESAPGTFATTQQRNEFIRDPGLFDSNLGVFKLFNITERQNVEFRAEFFNLLNHPNKGTVNINPVSSAFGRVTSKTNERDIQLSLKYRF